MATTWALFLCSFRPNFKFDQPLLEDFLAPSSRLHFLFAFEVRHPSWYTEETYAVLRQHGTALLFWPRRRRKRLWKSSQPILLMFACDVKTTRQSNWRLGGKRFDEWLRKGVNVYAYCKHEDAGKRRRPTRMGC